MEAKKVNDMIHIECSKLEVVIIANVLEVYTKINPHDLLNYNIEEMIKVLKEQTN